MPNGWWFPAPISHQALGYDAQFMRTLFACIVIFVLAQVGLIGIVWHYRARRTAGKIKIVNSKLEPIWTSAIAILFLGLLALGGGAWAGVQFTPAPRDAEEVEVLAKQFTWSFRYAGSDGRFGRTDIRLVNDASGNPFGLDDQDPAAKDDIVSSTLRVPAGRPVKLVLTSSDVIHSFFVRELRIKQDLVPGMRIPLPIKPESAGSYEVPCAELCGLGHYQMRTVMIVMPAERYDAWKREQKH
jgi:cytochrome c oxidase subunit 2